MKESHHLAGRWGGFKGHLFGLGDMLGGSHTRIRPPVRGNLAYPFIDLGLGFLGKKGSLQFLGWESQTLEGRGGGAHVQATPRSWVGGALN